MGDALQDRDERGRVTAASLTQHACGHVADPTAALQTGLVKSKGDLFESVPLFLSHQYKGMFDQAVERADNWQTRTRDLSGTSQSPSRKDPDAAKKQKMTSKTYRSQWVLEKLAQQRERKTRAAKGARGQAGGAAGASR